MFDSMFETVPVTIIFKDGTEKPACCGRAVLDEDSAAVFGYRVDYSRTHRGECANHPRPMTDASRHYMEEDCDKVRAWFASHHHDSRI